VIWLILNLALLVSMWAYGQANAITLELAALALPGFIAGVIIGSNIKLNARAFKAATWSMLLLIGIIQLVRVFLLSRS